MPIVNLKSNLKYSDKSILDLEGTMSTTSFEKDYEYDTMTVTLLDQMLADCSNGLSVASAFPQKADGTAIDKVKILHDLSITFKHVANDNRSIMMLKDPNQSLGFVAGLTDARIYTHDTKFKEIFIVEKGFGDLEYLQIKYIEFLTQISKCVNNDDIQLSELKKYFDIKDIQLEGQLLTKFSFLFEGIRWSVTVDPNKN